MIATGNQTIRINKMFLPFDSDGQVISMVAENGAFIQNGQNLLHQSIIDPIKTKRIYDLLPTLNPRPTLVVFAGKDRIAVQQIKKTLTAVIGPRKRNLINWNVDFCKSFDRNPIRIKIINCSSKKNSCAFHLNRFLPSRSKSGILSGKNH
ncbi:HAD hydrolase family protein [Oenococcus oeni]|uniref:HAD hydrolase family protein n=1 Tax=Oenococcus oeni TaxID=1247 RepID=UPI0030CA4632